MMQCNIRKQICISYEYQKKFTRDKIVRNLKTSLLGDIDNFWSNLTSINPLN